MRYRLDLLIAGRSPDDVAALEAILSTRGDLNVRTRVLVNGYTDPLRDIYPMPDALVMVVGKNWLAELEGLQQLPPNARPPLLVVGESGNSELIRVAMRAGARDFLSPPLDQSELDQFISELLLEKRTESSHKAARLTAVINAKGGSGASMVAANLAHILASSLQRRTVLMDLDVQFGSLPVYFNLTPRNGLIRALETVDSLDLMALEGYVLTYGNGLDLLAATPEDRVTLADLPEDRVELLLKLLGEVYDDIVVDVPRWIGGATALTLEHADHVLVVMEQGVAHLRDAQQLISVLRGELNVADSQITVLANRFHKSNPVSMADIEGALPDLRTASLPNDYKRVNQSINVGHPLKEFAPNAPITRQLTALVQSLSEGAGQVRARGSRWGLLNWARQSIQVQERRP